MIRDTEQIRSKNYLIPCTACYSSLKLCEEVEEEKRKVEVEKS